MLDRVEQALVYNETLTDELKTNILELVVIFNNKFPDVDLTNLSRRLKTLQIKKISKFLNQDVSMYDNKDNIIYFNLSEMNKNYDMKHVLMFELLNVISATEYSTGFNEYAKFEALNVGYTEILANFLVGNNGEIMLFKDEAIQANIISVLIGNKNLKDAYFKNDSRLLLESFNRVGVNV